jgi:putative ABC transport system permease protein
MSTLLKQIYVITNMNIHSIPQRFGLSLATIFSVALVVGVLLCFLSMANGFKKILESTGSDDIAIIMRSGAQKEVNSVIAIEQTRLLAEGPGIVRINGQPEVSGELYIVVDALKKSSQSLANISLRGIGEFGLKLRPNAHIIAGRMLHPGTNEIVVGKNLLSQFEGFELDKIIRLGNSTWRIVGIFESPGSIFESELWADVSVVQSIFNRLGYYQTMRVKLINPTVINNLREFANKDPRLMFDIKSEKEFYDEQSKAASDWIFYLGWPLSIAMAFGAFAGATNAMYNSVATRMNEIITLRILGYSPIATFIGTLAESIVLTIIGGTLGTLFSYFLFDGFITSTLSSNFTQVVFRFDLTLLLMLQGMLFAFVIGLFGGLFPAYNASRMSLITKDII